MARITTMERFAFRSLTGWFDKLSPNSRGKMELGRAIEGHSLWRLLWP